MALRARKVFGAFEKRAPLQVSTHEVIDKHSYDHARLTECLNDFIRISLAWKHI